MNRNLFVSDHDDYDADYAEDEDEDEEESNEVDENTNDLNENEEENENYNEDEYDYGNPNPVFRQEDFDPLPANASHPKRTFQDLAEADEENRVHNYEEAGDYYEENNAEDRAAEHDIHVNGRMLHSKASADGAKETHQGDVYDNRKALPSDITRLRTPLKRQENHAIQRDHRHSPSDRRHSNSHKGISKELEPSNVPKHVDGSLGTNLERSVIRTSVVNRSDTRGREWVEAPATQIQTPRLPRRLGPVVYSNDGYPIVEDSIYWSQQVDSFVPRGESPPPPEGTKSG